LRLYVFSFKAMGSPCQIQFFSTAKSKARPVYGRIIRRIACLERRYSRFLQTSLVAEVNRKAGSGVRTRLVQEDFALLCYADQCYRESRGLFDVTSGLLNKVWHDQLKALPKAHAIDQALAKIGWDKVIWDQNSLYLPVAGMQIDFGGIVKEYAADSVVNLCRACGVHSGIVELGGDVRVIGAQPNGQGWPVAIRDPFHPGQVLSRIELRSGALASSGDYERYIEIDGHRYGHIFNPKTGQPVTGLSGASVLGGQCVVAGSLATIALLQGTSGADWLAAQSVPFLACLSTGRVIDRISGVCA